MPDLPSALRDLVDGAAAPPDVDGIVRARRRRRLRRRAALGTAVVVVAAVVTGGVVVGRRSGNGHKIVSVGNGGAPSESDATQAALAQLTILSPGGGTGALTGAPQTVDVTNPETGRSHVVPFPIAGAQSIGYPFLALGSNVVITVNSQTGPYDPSIGQVYVASPTMQLRGMIGPASYVFAALDADRLWLASDNATPDQRLHGQEYGTTRTVKEVGLDGHSVSPSYPLTDRRSPIAAVTGGLLTSRPGPRQETIYEVWDPATDAVVRTLDIRGVPSATSGDAVAWTDSACSGLASCPMHVTDIERGTDRLVAPPRGDQWQGAAFSPDGAQLALTAVPRSTPADVERSIGVPSGTRTVDVAIVAAVTGAATTRSTTVWKGSSPPTWSPDGSLVFFVRDATHVAYFNAKYPASPVRDFAIDRADLALVVAKAVTATDAPRYSYDGPIAQMPQHRAELCVYATTKTFDGDGCTGPEVIG